MRSAKPFGLTIIWGPLRALSFEGEAIRKAAVILGLPAKEENRLRILVRWAVEVGLLERGAAGLVLAKAIEPTGVAPSVAPSSTDTDSPLAARLYNAARLGQAAHDELDEADRGLLAEALVRVDRDPSGAASRNGQALEDYLRDLARQKGLVAEAAKANGAVQLANLLLGKGVIHMNQQKLVEAVGVPRNATSHHKDKKTLAPWTISAEAALGAHLLTLVAIRSIHEFHSTTGQVI